MIIQFREFMLFYIRSCEMPLQLDFDLGNFMGIMFLAFAFCNHGCETFSD